MLHYSVTANEDVQLIDLRYVELQNSMTEILKEKSIDIDNYIVLNRLETYRLSRMENMEDTINAGTPLPPVKLKRQPEISERVLTPSPRLMAIGAKPSIIKAKPVTYSVEDGRHRVVASIIKGYTHIPAIIID
jgi:hypothetical protein